MVFEANRQQQYARELLFSTVVELMALVVLGLLARHAIRDLPRLSRVGPAHAVALGFVAGTLVLLGAGMGSLNADVQQLVVSGRWGYG